MKYKKSTKGICPSGHADQYVVTKSNNRYCRPCYNDRARGYMNSRDDKPTYMAWLAMKRRCTNPNAQNFYLYGGRGITFDKSWDNYKTFLTDMGEKPDKKYSLERINNELGYSKENCKWADRYTQANNKRNNRFLEFDGRRMTLAQWSRETGIRVGTIWARIEVQGWTIHDALTTNVCHH